MSGNSESAKKAYQTRLSRHGKESLRNMQSAGGKSSHVGGFGTKEVGEDGLTGKERARIASIESHKIRKHNLTKEYEEEYIDENENISQSDS